MSWIYKNKLLTEVPEGYIGFVYKISCINKSNEYYSWTYFGMKLKIILNNQFSFD